MISISNNQVMVNINGMLLHQTHHHDTGEEFKSEQQCFGWLIASGWFDRCKQEAILKIKEQAKAIIHEQVPPFKQLNAALGVYSKEKTKQIVNIIQSVRAAVDKREQDILAAKSLKKFQELLAAPLLDANN